MATLLKQSAVAGFLKKLFLLPIYMFFLVSSLYTLTGCGNDRTAGAWSDFKPLNNIDKYIEEYYEASLGSAAKIKIDSPAIYVDFSDGLIQAFKSNNSNQAMITNVAEQFGNSKNVWWGLGQKAYAGVGRLEEVNDFNLLKAIIANSASYQDIYAPIEAALKQITTSSNDALLITDFEEYRSDYTENTLDFASAYFIDWIKKGNTITFKYSPYQELNKSSGISGQKNLYLIFFTFGKQTDESLISQFTRSLQNTETKSKTFELTNNSFTVSNDYGGNAKTGISNIAFEKWINSNKNGLVIEKLPYEFIGINKPWDDGLDKYVTNIIEKESGLFLSKLSLNASRDSCFRLKKMGVKVYDVSEDFEKFSRCKEVKNHAPILILSKEHDSIWDEKSKKDPVIQECYVSNTKNIKQEWIYTSAHVNSNEWQEIFDLDKNIFSAHLNSTPENISLNTIFHSNYKIKGIKRRDALIRVDYIIEEASPNLENLPAEDFSWPSIIKKENGVNKSLYKAIERTLQEPAVNPKGKIIYSYYIKFANVK